MGLSGARQYRDHSLVIIPFSRVRCAPAFKTARRCPGNAGKMRFDTKIAIAVQESLAAWQKLNVTAFLAKGLPLHP
jgi:hypothetical protein